jgi:hypothetical protein
MPRGKNPKSLANLKPAKKGEVRNPKGVNNRPFTDLYYDVSQEIVPEWWRRKLNRWAGFELHPKGTNWAAADARALHMKASRGEVSAVKELADRCEGRAPERLEIVGKTRQFVTLRVVFGSRKADGTWAEEETLTTPKSA